MDVSPATVKKAKAVRGDPILGPAVRAGTISVDAAYKARRGDDDAKEQLVAGERAAARPIAPGAGDWTTPDRIISMVLPVFNHRIDLDPASSVEAQETVKAKRFLTPKEDALLPQTSWGKPGDKLNAWLNPPTGEMAPRFVDRLFEALESGAVDRACWLAPAAFEEMWCQTLLRRSTAFASLQEPVRKGSSSPYVLIFFRVPAQGGARGDRRPGTRVHAVSAIDTSYG